MTLCDDTRLQELMTAIAADNGDEIALVDRAPGGLLRRSATPFPARLAACRNRPADRGAKSRSRRRSSSRPIFAIARFQLGFFQLTSGEATDALSTWGPLALLPEGHYLRTFRCGLTYLIRDEFGPAIEQLRLGIAANEENLPLNRDMQLIIDRISDLATGKPGDETMSATSFAARPFFRPAQLAAPMTQISATDQILLLLREQLQRSERGRARVRIASSAKRRRAAADRGTCGGSVPRARPRSLRWQLARAAGAGSDRSR